MNLTELQQRALDAYNHCIGINIEPNNRNIGKIVYGDFSSNSQIKANALMKQLKSKGLINGEEKEEQESIDPEQALIRMVKLLGSLKNSQSMKKIIEHIKQGAFTKDEMYCLLEMSKIMDELEKEDRDRIYHYIGSKFHF